MWKRGSPGSHSAAAMLPLLWHSCSSLRWSSCLRSAVEFLLISKRENFKDGLGKSGKDLISLKETLAIFSRMHVTQNQ